MMMNYVGKFRGVLLDFLGSAARCVFGRERETRRPGPNAI